MGKKALICGVTGQDGSLLAKFLLKQGYEVHGTSRDAYMCSKSNLRMLGIEDRVQLESMVLSDFRSVLQVLSKVEPDEIYNLAGQSSVGLSFEQPVEAMESISVGTLFLLEGIRFLNRKIRFYNAGSSECFGSVSEPANELTVFRPRSPYAVAKSAAFWQVQNYRSAYGLFACSGILFNHESVLRPDRFVTQKIVTTAVRISRGEDIRLELGNIEIVRDWGWAPEYVETMWRILQCENPEDFVVATGRSISLRTFVSIAFSKLDLDWKDHTSINQSLYRPDDSAVSLADPSKAEALLNWKASHSVEDVIEEMINGKLTGAL